MRIVLYILTLTWLTFSCVPKKYGRHFNSPFDYSSTSLRVNSSANEPQYSASIKDTLILSETAVTVSENNSSISGRSETKSLSKSPKKDLNKFNVLRKNRPGQIGEKNKVRTAGRKTEPLGLASFGLFFLTILMFASGGAIGMSSGLAAVLILGSMVLGGVSVYKIRENKKKWKGRFFGTFVAIAGLLFLFLLGLSAFIGAAFG